MKNDESFDNISINSQDYHVGNEVGRKANHDYNDITGEIYVDNFLNENGTKSMPPIVEDSSEEDEEVSFIREISTPLLSKSEGKRRSAMRNNIKQRKKLTKVIGACLVFSVVLAFAIVGFLIFLPSSINKKIMSLFMSQERDDIIGCNILAVEDVWVKSFPRLISEGAIRLVKIDNDDVFDFVIPFGTNVVESEISHFVCQIYYNDQKRCFGGLLALNGKNGDVLWRYDASGEMYALTCSEDLNKDEYIDCLGAGRVGTLAAVSGRDGSELWAFDKNPERSSVMNLYTPQFIDDVDGDGVRDVLEMHGGDPIAKPNEMNRLIAKLIVFSGRTGNILVSKSVSDSHESYYSPQVLNSGDGGKSILFGTGGETFPGNLFISNLQLLLRSRTDSKLISKSLYHGPKKGVMTPPVLVDLNSDGREDIVICPFGDVCMAIDGVTYNIIWTFDKINSSETYASPAAGYYNEDNVPDIFIQLFVGLGYPVYFYGETIILDGRNGQVIKQLNRSNNVVITSPLTLSVEGNGNDIFLYWLQMCRGYESEIDTTPFKNLPQFMLSRANVCKLRFNTTTESVFLAHGRNLNNQSASIYNNANYFHIEHDFKINPNVQMENYLKLHPELRKIYNTYKLWLKTQHSDPSSDPDEYDTNEEYRKNYHDKLVNKQQNKPSIDLEDANIHNSIDFETPLPKKDDENIEEYMKGIFGNMNKEDQISDGDQPLIRSKRHNGPHDGEGQQRMISTGTLTPPMLANNDPHFNQSMDIVFATYWSTASEVSLQTKKEMKCNKIWMENESQRFKANSKFKHYDHDHYSEYGNRYCSKKYGKQAPPSKIEKDYTMFNIHSGQLTIFRKRLKCTCSSALIDQNQRCSRVLPFHLQTWPAYLGLSGSAHWNSSYYHLMKV